MINQYIETKKLQGERETTLENLRRVLRLYSEFSKGDIFTLESLSAWRAHLVESGAKQSTIQYYFVVLRGFFAYCVSENVIEQNPVELQAFPKAKKKKLYKNLLTEEEIKLLLNPQRPSGATRKTWVRNYAIIVLLLTTSIRNSELRSLRPCDLLRQESAIFIEDGKGGQSRYVSAPQVCFDAIDAYMKERPQNLTGTDWLFGVGESDWHQLSRVGLSSLVERHVSMVTGREGIRSHAMRHAGASLMVTHGVNMKEIQEQLGHSNYSTTEIYAELLRRSSAPRNTTLVFDNLRSEAI